MKAKGVDRLRGVEGATSAEQSNQHSRRQFLARVGLTGIGMAALATVGEETATANPPDVEDIRATYVMNQNLYEPVALVLNQNGNFISGTFEYGNEGRTPVSGIVVGKRPGPITIVFNRTLSDGTIQTHVGAVSVLGPTGPGSKILLAGVFYHNGWGPFPWSAFAP